MSPMDKPRRGGTRYWKCVAPESVGSSTEHLRAVYGLEVGNGVSHGIMGDMDWRPH